jgi:hypothetical protein
MANAAVEADRLFKAGRKKTLRAGLLWGGPLLALAVLAGLHWAGAIRLEEYFAADPNRVDHGAIWLALDRPEALFIKQELERWLSDDGHRAGRAGHC